MNSIKSEKYQKRNHKPLSLDYKSLEQHDKLGHAELGYEDIETEMVLDDMTTKSTERDRKILKMAWQGMTQEEIAEKIGGLSRQSVYAAIKRFAKKQRGYFYGDVRNY